MNETIERSSFLGRTVRRIAAEGLGFLLLLLLAVTAAAADPVAVNR